MSWVREDELRLSSPNGEENAPTTLLPTAEQNLGQVCAWGQFRRHGRL